MTGLLTIVLATADPNLASAEAAWARGEYEQVMPLLEQALDHPLPREELIRAYALEGHVHVAFDRLELATAAFRRLLGVDDHYLMEPDASPKLLAVFAEARRLGPVAPPKAALIEPVKPPEVPLTAPAAVPLREPSVSSRLWWVWAAVSLLAVGAAAGFGIWYFERPIVPAGSLGTGLLR